MPVINSPQKVENWASASKAATKIVLFPGADKKLTDLNIKESVAIAIGPEGDFTEQEIETLTEFGFVPVTIGNRILRAETATIAAISALRYGKKEF